MKPERALAGTRFGRARYKWTRAVEYVDLERRPRRLELRRGTSDQMRCPKRCVAQRDVPGHAAGLKLQHRMDASHEAELSGFEHTDSGHLFMKRVRLHTAHPS